MGETWIDDEELAYPAGSIRQSRRRGVVRYPDGKLRKVRLGVPDTFFSIPARGKANGKTLSGFVSVVEIGDTADTQREFRLTVKGKGAGVQLVPALY